MFVNLFSRRKYFFRNFFFHFRENPRFRHKFQTLQKQELVKFLNHLEEASTAYGTQISAEKTNGISTDITIDNKKLENDRSFKYLGAIVSDEGSEPDVLSRIARLLLQ